MTATVLAERIDNERALREQSEASTALALARQSEEYARRLAELNHAHEQAVVEQARTVPREMFDNYVKESDQRLVLVAATLQETIDRRFGAVEKELAEMREAQHGLLPIDRFERDHAALTERYDREHAELAKAVATQEAVTIRQDTSAEVLATVANTNRWMVGLAVAVGLSLLTTVLHVLKVI